VFLYHGTTTFEECHFVNNTAYGGGDGGSHDTGGGGGIFNDHGKCILESSTFDSNVATGPSGTGGHHGGAVMNIEGLLTVRNSNFINCDAYQGGALYTWMWGTIIAVNSKFHRNTASFDRKQGGAIFSDRGIVNIHSCLFDRNDAPSGGGGIYAWQVAGGVQNVTITNATFIGNMASSGNGGAIGNWHSTIFVIDSFFDANTANKTGGAIWNDASSTTVMENTVFTVNNSAPVGGVVFDNPKGTANITKHCIFEVDDPSQGTTANISKYFPDCSIQSLEVRVVHL